MIIALLFITHVFDIRFKHFLYARLFLCYKDCYPPELNTFLVLRTSKCLWKINTINPVTDMRLLGIVYTYILLLKATTEYNGNNPKHYMSNKYDITNKEQFIKIGLLSFLVLFSNLIC